MGPEPRAVNPNSAEDAVIPTMACPRCGEHKCRPSMKSGPVEVVLAWFSVRPYRCRGCRHRFYRMGPPPTEMEILAKDERPPNEEEDGTREEGK